MRREMTITQQGFPRTKLQPYSLQSVLCMRFQTCDMCIHALLLHSKKILYYNHKKY